MYAYPGVNAGYGTDKKGKKMSYTTVKDGLCGLLTALGYAESGEDSFATASNQEFANTFILSCISGTAETNSHNLADRLYDYQTWRITIAFSKSKQNDQIVHDDLNKRREEIQKTFDNPANWVGFARMIQYSSWAVEVVKDYYVLTIEFLIQDTITH